jgi:hypothetical protein
VPYSEAGVRIISKRTWGKQGQPCSERRASSGIGNTRAMVDGSKQKLEGEWWMLWAKKCNIITSVVRTKD